MSFLHYLRHGIARFRTLLLLIPACLLGAVLPAVPPAATAQINANVFLPVVLSPPADLYGTVTYRRQPIEGINVVLLTAAPPDGKPIQLDQVTTNAAGRYWFRNVPKGNYYKGVRTVFSNSPSSEQWDQRFASSCSTHALATVTGGQQKLGDFDIANIAPDRPPDGSRQAFPVTFSWTHDIEPGGSYTVTFYALDSGQDIAFPANAPGKSLTLTTLPPGFAYGPAYPWYVYYAGNQGSCTSATRWEVIFQP